MLEDLRCISLSRTSPAKAIHPNVRLLTDVTALEIVIPQNIVMYSEYFLWALLSLLIGIAAWCLYSAVTSPLRTVPGPAWARFTNMWYVQRLLWGHFGRENLSLHLKYGNVVRLGPNLFSVRDPASIKQVYGIGTKFAKSAWYDGFNPNNVHIPPVFQERDIKKHAAIRKSVASIYSMSSVASYEAAAENCTQIFKQRLDEFASNQEVIDLGYWLQCYAFDVIACITFGDRFGFLNSGLDPGGLIPALWNFTVTATLVGIYPWSNSVVYNLLSLFPTRGNAMLVKFVRGHILSRMESRSAQTHPTRSNLVRNPDFLDRLLDLHEADKRKVNMGVIETVGMSNVVAGSDTTSISLSAILYYLIKTPSALVKLRKELEAVEPKQENGIISLKKALTLPYLQAVIKEALRLHPATGLPMWRSVPAGGARISGYDFPEGAVIGMNSWTAHYDPDVFGTDVNEFRPERWLETLGDGELLKRMESSYMPFGIGSRVCLGRHISILEMNKLVPFLALNYHLETVLQENEEWDNVCSWFVKPVNFKIKVKRREWTENTGVRS